MVSSHPVEVELTLSSRQAAAFRKNLLSFYDSSKRDLPWRKTDDPYEILVSEVMLQQTQVTTVIPRWHSFLKLFPTVRALAAAREEQVCEAWAGLGYYRRARNLHKSATQIMSEHDGAFPRQYDAILGLAGVGRYTAGAIASIAYGDEVPVVDGNVIRVLARFFAIDRTKDDSALHRAAWRFMETLVVGERPGDFNQAMMELGATVCTPAQPTCVSCVLRRKCKAAAQDEPLKFPRPKPKKSREILHVALGIFRAEGTIAMVQRPLDGLWAGLWEPLSATGESPDAAKIALMRQHFDSGNATFYSEFRHILTHREVLVRIYEVEGSLRNSSSVFMTDEPRALGLSKLAVKALDAVSDPLQRELFD